MDKGPRIAHVDPELRVSAKGRKQAGEVNGMRWSARDYDVKPSFSQQSSRRYSGTPHPAAPTIWKTHRAAKNPAHRGDRPQQRESGGPI